MTRLIAAPSASCPQWSVAIVTDRDDGNFVPPKSAVVFGDGDTLEEAVVAADYVAEGQEG